jgi:hypothetical protein
LLAFHVFIEEAEAVLPRLGFLGAQLLCISCVDCFREEEDSAVSKTLLPV